MHFVWAARTDLGSKRVNNEDAHVGADHFVAVSDGVGGRPAGEVASRLAVDACHGLVAVGAPVEDAVRGASALVRSLGTANSLLTSMCATLTAISLDRSGGAVVGHVGDSVAWLLRDGNVERLTTDQTVTSRMVRDGELTPEEVATHPKRATLYQVIGTDPERLEVDVRHVSVVPGVRFVLATDGLDYACGGDDAATDDLVRNSSSAGDPGRAAQALVEAALAGGGGDNVTVVVAEVVGPRAG